MAQIKMSDLNHKPNIELLEADQEEDQEKSAQESSDEQQEDESDDESEIEDDQNPQKVASKREQDEDLVSDDGEQERKIEKMKYKAKKSNPMIYSDPHQQKNFKKMEREEQFAKYSLNKSNYVQMLREDHNEEPEERLGGAGYGKNTEYLKEMQKLEAVENQFFTRMQMTKKQRNHHENMMKSQGMDNLKNIDDFGEIEKIFKYKELKEKNESHKFSSGSNVLKKNLREAKNDRKRQKH